MTPICDFCGEQPSWELLAHDVKLPTIENEETGERIETVSIGSWFACEECHELIAQEAWDKLAQHSLEMYERKYGRNIASVHAELLTVVKAGHRKFCLARFGERRLPK